MYLEHHYPQFFSATCLQWQSLLEQDKFKDKIIEDLRFLVSNHWAKVYAFVLMPNHVHYIWHAHPKLNYTKMKGGHLRNTAQKIKHNLILNEEHSFLEKFYVGAKDRAYQFWERNPRSVDVYTPSIMHQKIDYIHANPVIEKWSLCAEPKDYKYSSAEFYETGIDRFGIITHISEIGNWTKDPVKVESKYF